MKGRRFATIEKIKTESLRGLKDMPKITYQKCFEARKKRWHKCVISKGGYFEGDNIEIHELINIEKKKNENSPYFFNPFPPKTPLAVHWSSGAHN